MGGGQPAEHRPGLAPLRSTAGFAASEVQLSAGKVRHHLEVTLLRSSQRLTPHPCRPEHTQYALTARWLVHHNSWGVLVCPVMLLNVLQMPT